MVTVVLQKTPLIRLRAHAVKSVRVLCTRVSPVLSVLMPLITVGAAPLGDPPITRALP